MEPFLAEISRRRFIQVVPFVAGSLAQAATSAPAAESVLRPETGNIILGPFYPLLKPADRDSDLTLVRGRKRRASGQVVHLSGRVVNQRGEPVRDARVEIWQANTYGRYAHASDPNTNAPLDEGFQGYGVQRTDGEGRYRFTTIKPGPYPTRQGDMRAPHIHFDVQCRIDRKVTQLFFPNEPLNDQDRFLRAVPRRETVIATLRSAPNKPSELIAEWEIVVASG